MYKIVEKKKRKCSEYYINVVYLRYGSQKIFLPTAFMGKMTYQLFIVDQGKEQILFWNNLSFKIIFKEKK